MRYFAPTLVAAAAACLAGAAQAADNYDFQQTFAASGVLGGQSFTDQLISIMGVTDQDPIVSPGFAYAPLMSAVVSGRLDTGASFSASFIGPTAFFADSNNGDVDFIEFTTVLSITKSPSLENFYLSYSFGPIVGASFLQQFSEETTDGDFFLSSIVGNSTFQEVVTPITSAVPEPASWALMLGGIGMLGAFLRIQHARRHKDQVTDIASA